MRSLPGRFWAALVWVFFVVIFISLREGLFDDPQEYTSPLSSGAFRFIAGSYLTSGLLLFLPATQATVRLFCLLLILPLAFVAPPGLSGIWWAAVWMGLGLLASVLQVRGLTPDRYLVSDPGLKRPDLAFFLRRSLLQIGLSGLIGAFLVSGVIGVNRLGRDHLAAWFNSAGLEQRTGLSAFVELGSIDALKRSDRTLLHVRGQAPELLRARVFSRYQNGRWLPDQEGASPLGGEDEPPSGAGVVQFRRVSGKDSWVALPPEPGRVWSDIALERDAAGVVRGARGRSPDRWSWVRGGEGIASAPEDEARLLAVPTHLSAVLAQKSKEWLGERPGSFDPAAQLEALRRGLMGSHRYSLDFERTAGIDPVLDFLSQNPQGNCEAFASAYVLLSRSLGIPARVVTGFRVSERNPFSGHWLIRERNAHAWAEVRVDGRWESRDPTPAVMQDGSESSISQQLFWFFDVLRLQGFRLRDRMFDMTLDEVALLVLLLGGVLVGYQLRRNWNRRVERLGLQAEGSGVLPEFLALEKRLQELGFVRLRGETLAGFSRRLERAGEPFVRHAEWIRKYAAWRYGGVGTGAELKLPPAESAK